MMQDEQLLAAFQVQGKLLLVQEVGLQLAQRFRGLEPRPGLAEQLAIALRRLSSADCQLSLPQQVEVATFFMPLTRLAVPGAAVGIPPMLFASVEPLAPPLGYLITGSAQLNDAHLVSLELVREGIVVVSTTALHLSFTEPLVTGQAVRFLLRATYSDYPTQTKPIVLQPTSMLRAGTNTGMPTVATVESWIGINVSADVPITFIAQGYQQYMFCWVPADREVTGIFNPEFGQTNLLPSFSFSPLTLPTYGPGVLWKSKQRILSSGYGLHFTLRTTN